MWQRRTWLRRKYDKASTGSLSIEHSFIEQFDLKQKLSRSRATLSAMWVQENAYYGKTVERSILIQDPVEKVYFLELAPACDPKKHQTRHYITQKEEPTSQGQLEQVSIVCDNDNAKKTRYFLQIAPVQPQHNKAISAKDVSVFNRPSSQDDMP